jgi:hypothetical protein
MSAQKITEEQWAAARKRYETEPGLGYGTLAQAFDCSKNLVARKAKEQGWQKGIGVLVQVHAKASDGNPKFTESAGASDAQAVHVYAEPTENRVAGAALSASSPPAHSAQPEKSSKAAPASAGVFQIAEPADDLSPALRREHVRRECEALATAMNGRHALELRGLQNAFATDITKGDPKDRGPALRLKALTESTAMRHKMQREALTDFAKLRLGEFDGIGTGVMFVVHLVPGLRIGEGEPAPVAGTKLVQVASLEDATRVLRGDVVDVEAKTYEEHDETA